MKNERQYSGERTLKAKVLDFVENQGAARFTDIQRFIVDEMFGSGTYDSGIRLEESWVSVGYVRSLDGMFKEKPVTSLKSVKRNKYRGYHTTSIRSGGYFRNETGYGHLEKCEDGLYRTIRK